MESALYTGPLTITNDPTILACAFERGGKRISPISKEVFQNFKSPIRPPAFRIGAEANLLEADLSYSYDEDL